MGNKYYKRKSLVPFRSPHDFVDSVSHPGMPLPMSKVDCLAETSTRIPSCVPRSALSVKVPCRGRPFSLSLHTGTHDLVALPDSTWSESVEKFPSFSSSSSPSSVSRSLPLSPSKSTLNNDALILLDWDDTLFPRFWLSTWVADILRPGTVPSEVTRAMETFERAAIAVIEEALKHGCVWIVTNSERGWVELTASRYLPRLAAMLGSRVKVISARSEWDHVLSSPVEWKLAAFRKIVLACSEVPSVIMSVGDSWVEREALSKLAGDMASPVRLRSIKLLDDPLNALLRSQLEMLTTYLEDLLRFDRSWLDLVIAPH